jgi:hypothetical protein
MIEQVNINRIINISADQAWAAISGIGGLERWFPIIAACTVSGEGVGALRTLTLEDGAQMIDVIEEIDHQHKRLRYKRIQLPFPVSSYVGTVDIRASAQLAAEIMWCVEMQPEEGCPADLADFIYTAISDGIQGMERDVQNA